MLCGRHHCAPGEGHEAKARTRTVRGTPEAGWSAGAGGGCLWAGSDVGAALALVALHPPSPALGGALWAALGGRPRWTLVLREGHRPLRLGAPGSAAVWAPEVCSGAGRRVSAGPATWEPAQLRACRGPGPPPPTRLLSIPLTPGPSPLARTTQLLSTSPNWGALDGGELPSRPSLRCSTQITAPLSRTKPRGLSGSSRVSPEKQKEQGGGPGVRPTWVHAPALCLKTFPDQASLVAQG